jgi:nucleoside-diphosphate-sugar epimerase
VLDAASAAGVTHVVVLSTAMVYGAWGNNPVPLTEDAPLRPDPSLVYASARAESMHEP